MSTVTTDDIEAVMAVGIESDALQAVIDREEARLADDPVFGIGQLVGERTQTLWVTAGDGEPLLLARPTDGLESVIDAGVELAEDAVELTGPARIERVGGTWRGPKLQVKYTPSDEAAVKRVVIELVRLTLTDSPYQQESSEGHQYARALGGAEKLRAELGRSLNPHQGLMTMRLRPAAASSRLTD